MLLQKLKKTPETGMTAFKSALRVSAMAALVGFVSTSTASAGTIVEAWDFTLDNAFIAWTQVGEVPPAGVNFGDVEGDNPNALLAGPPFNFPDTPSLLRWGLPQGGGMDPADQSSIEVGFSNGHFDSTTDGTMTGLTTDIQAPNMPVQAGNIVPTVVITHANNPLGASANMDTATLFDVLILSPTAPPAAMPGPFTVDPLVFSIRFAETSNSPNQGGTADPNECADITSPMGSGCNDIFVLDVPLAAFDPGDASLNQAFVFDEHLYNVKLQLEGIGIMAGMGLRQLTEKECAAVVPGFVQDADPTNNCIGLTTIEGQVNSFQNFLSIQHIRAVPEPGALAVFGLGLAGLGFMRRRRKV